MPRFEWTAMDAGGVETGGVLDVATPSDALSTIRSSGLFPTRVAKLGSRYGAPPTARMPAHGVTRGLHREMRLPDFLCGRTQKGRYVFDRMKLASPLFGSLFVKTAVSRFSRTLGTLLSSGVPVLQALNIVGETSGNALVARAVMDVRESVKEGEGVSAPLEAAGLFPEMVVSMVRVGEETGALPEMLTRVANTYDEEVDAAVEGLTSIIEPVMIVILAFIVGTIVIAMFMPLIALMGGMG